MSDQSKYRSKTLVKTFTEAGIEVQSLKGVTLEKPDNEFFELTPKEIKIHQLLFNLLGLCKKKFCVIVEDDFKPLIVGNNLVNKLFSELITFNSNDQYLFDCTKWGFFQKEYPISGNSLACRIAHYQLLRKVKKCYKDKKQINVPADVFYRDCLDKELLERRFLLGNTVDGSNY
ncbi:hypothetical protein K502DRAFT_325622 [Neoconidiobolus thromboides FSU 785]|nr:hypothetical protein K502DRAFT_325622 [Neoconidiobolus thromboides FSU 785]